jgi:hypothetical protein
VTNHSSIFNYLPGITGVAGNKKRLASIFKRLTKNHPKEFDFVPSSFLMPEEEIELKAHMSKCNGKTFICKPSDGSEGCGIILA